MQIGGRSKHPPLRWAHRDRRPRSMSPALHRIVRWSTIRPSESSIVTQGRGPLSGLLAGVVTAGLYSWDVRTLVSYSPGPCPLWRRGEERTLKLAKGPWLTGPHQRHGIERGQMTRDQLRDGNIASMCGQRPQQLTDRDRRFTWRSERIEAGEVANVGETIPGGRDADVKRLASLGEHDRSEAHLGCDRGERPGQHNDVLSPPVQAPWCRA